MQGSPGAEHARANYHHVESFHLRNLWTGSLTVAAR
jgi:hypothetical protein